MVKLPGSKIAVGGKSICAPGFGCIPFDVSSSRRVVGSSMSSIYNVAW